VVERRTKKGWEPYADMTGELPVTLEFPQGQDTPSYLTGTHEWRWTAHFEAFASTFDTGRGDLATPPGEYRFTVRGKRRQGRQPVPYELTSQSFQVRPWSGIAVEDLRTEADARVSFRTGPRDTRSLPADEDRGWQAISSQIGPIDYPDTYASSARFVDEDYFGRRDPADPNNPSPVEWYCDRCTWRPWIDFGEAESATFTFVAADGSRRRVRAALSGGRWVSKEALGSGESAFVAAGGVVDRFGNFNGTESGSVGG
jgi:hypothetical protein